MEANMPGDPKECRQHALNCVQLAKTAELPEEETALPILREPGLGWLKLMQAVLAEDDAEQELEQTG